VETHVVPLVHSKGLNVSYSAESSVERELARESFMDVSTVALSYAAMFVYIAVALSQPPPPSDSPPSLLVRAVYTRCSLALGGTCVVLVSVLAALGVCALCGIPASLIILEVVPFLILAIGVDNMFLLATLEAEQPRDMDIMERIALTLEVAGPSIALASLSEVIAFAVAAFTPTPAVRNFAIVAAVAVLIDFAMQVTAFVALLALDCERMHDGHTDCMPCCHVAATHASPPPCDFFVDSGTEACTDEDSFLPGEEMEVMGSKEVPRSTALRVVMGKLHAHVVAPQLGKLLVLAGCLVSVLLSLSAIGRVRIGLDQSVALPRDSYLQNYYQCALPL
jgi:Niemann-Pick C1 protein